uniref:PNPLA domain-containing protein n=1 Tax=Panagrellus redivivus TaxID=6233 RepID=A0A7E4W339_PANRE
MSFNHFLIDKEQKQSEQNTKCYWPVTTILHFIHCSEQNRVWGVAEVSCGDSSAARPDYVSLLGNNEARVLSISFTQESMETTCDHPPKRSASSDRRDATFWKFRTSTRDNNKGYANHYPRGTIMNEDNLEEFTLSFSGCGFLCIYHAGVVAAIKEYAPQLTNNKVCGASAGAIAAAGIVCGVSVSKAASTILAVVSQARQKLLGPLDSNFALMQLVRDGLNDTLPPNAAELCTGKLAISLTRYKDGANVIVSEFKTKDEVIDAIVCSCFIPFYCGFSPPFFRGVRYYDGGISDNQPRVDSKTITISPFSGESDICPPDLDSASIFGFDFRGTSIRFTSQNLGRIFATLIPVSQEACSRMCRQGFEDALRFLTRKGLTPCARCLTIQSYTAPAADNTTSHPTFRKRNSNSSVSFVSRGRIGSECDVCFDKADNAISSSVTTMLFPSIMQQTLDEAVTAEHWLFSYMFQFRFVRYTWRCMLPMIVPLQYTLFGLQKMASWIASLPQVSFMVEKLKEMILFVTTELERAYGPIFRLVRVSVKQIHSTMLCARSASGQTKIPDSSDCQTVLQSPIKTKIPSAHTKVPVSSPPAVPSVPEAPTFYSHEDGDDSMSNLIKLTQEHEAILAFHYTDDNDREQICQIFEIETPPTINRQHSHYHHVAHDRHNLPPIIAESDEGEGNGTNPPPAEDSGYSYAEDNIIVAPINRRDAACSPVRQLSNNTPSSSRSGSTTTSRRLANRRRPPTSRVHNTAMLPSGDTSNNSAMLSRSIFSSDSDPDAGGERLFVTNRRQRNASNEYDGDPEQSDADDQ